MCYIGLNDMENIGICIGGIEICLGGVFGVCVGEVMSVEENCDT